MNMEIPENHWPHSYLIFWIICIGITTALILFFKRRGWL
jgi:Mg2+ and Co2+ transporter CorA